MSRSVNRSYNTFGGCDFPRTKQVYVSFSNKRFRRYMKSNKDFDHEYFNKSFYKKFGGIDWEYRGIRKGSKLKKFKKFKLNLFRDDEGELNTFNLHKPIIYNHVDNIKYVNQYVRNNIVKIYPKEKIRFNLTHTVVSEARLELYRLSCMKRMSYVEFRDSPHRFNFTGDLYSRYVSFIKLVKDYYTNLKEELYSYSYVTKTTAHECFKRNQQQLQKYFIRKR